MTLALTYLGFFLAGLAGSLHCIGMCGPILTAIAGVDRRAELTLNGRGVAPTARRAAADLLWYHAGRLSTYAMLGTLAGALGAQLLEAVWLGSLQNWLGVAAGAMAMLIAAVLLIKPAAGCSRAFNSAPANRPLGHFLTFLRTLAAQTTPASRFLLGAIMGFLPCGLVYLMLAAVAATGHPLSAALGMIAFGLGTLPALTAVILAVRLVPIRWRRHGNRLAMLMAVVVGSMFLWRSWPVHAHASQLGEGTCPLCQGSQKPDESRGVAPPADGN